MVPALREPAPVRAGDEAGYGSVYDRFGKLIERPEEGSLAVATGWDMNVRSPWRRIAPSLLFMGFNGKATSRLYVTTRRIVLIREIDTWRELAGEMTILGTPAAAAKQARLEKLKASGVRQFCEILPDVLRMVASRKHVKLGSRLDLRLLAAGGSQYSISFWKTDGDDDEVLSLLESRFAR